MSPTLTKLIGPAALALCAQAFAAEPGIITAAPMRQPAAAKPMSSATPASSAMSATTATTATTATSAATSTTASPRSSKAAATPAGGLRQCANVEIDATEYVVLAKSTVVTLKDPIARMVVGSGRVAAATRPSVPAIPAGSGDTTARLAATSPKDAATAPAPAQDGQQDVVQITLLSPTQLFLLGTRAGSTNVVLQGVDGCCRIRDIVVGIDPSVLQAKLAELMPHEKDIRVKGAENALVLTGHVTDAVTLDDVLSLATSYGDGKKVVNLLRVSAPQQVMLEVKIAEVSKTLLDRFGLDFARLSSSASGGPARIASGIFGGSAALFGQFNPTTAAGIAGVASSAIGTSGSIGAATLNAATSGASLLGIDAQKKDGLVRVLAEPNIMAISGQSASFLSGGKIFIPVAQSSNGGGTVTTLEEKEFGVGLKFTPVVLDGTRVSLKVVSEVSELSQTGSPFTTVGGVTSVLPSIATRRVDTTVQLNDGQSFAVAGLIRNNVTETISRFPGVGEVPVVGALFRSTEFQNNQTELIFVITPRLVKPMNDAVALPTDHHVVPTRADVLFLGKAEGTPVKSTAHSPSRNESTP